MNLIPTATKLQLYKAAVLPYLTIVMSPGTSVERVIRENLSASKKEDLERFLKTNNLVMRNY